MIDAALYTLSQAAADDVVVAGVGNGIDDCIKQHPQTHDEEHHQRRRVHGENGDRQTERGENAENQHDGQADRQNID